MNRIGVFGGTFDPLHNGHIAVAEAAAADLSLDYVYLMPNNIQPFKQDREITANAHRLNMLRLAAAEIPAIRISTIELDREKVSYTYDSVQYLKKVHPDSELVFIMGADSLMSIERWYRGQDLLKSCSFAAGFRPGCDSSRFSEKMKQLKDRYGATIYRLDNMEIPISSTEIKEKLRSGCSIRGLVPDAVERYIDEHGLYIQHT